MGRVSAAVEGLDVLAELRRVPVLAVKDEAGASKLLPISYKSNRALIYTLPTYIFSDSELKFGYST
jgi:hypothetical protein